MWSARLKERHSSIDVCTPTALSNDDFMSFYNDNILTISDKILHPPP